MILGNKIFLPRKRKGILNLATLVERRCIAFSHSFINTGATEMEN